MPEYYADDQVRLLLGDALETLRTLPEASVDCIITSPPYYGLRDYGIDGQYGLEASPADYVETMRAVFAEARRVLTVDGTCWINIGDSYAWSSVPGGGLPDKNLLGIPWRLAFALQDDGWILRNDIIWHKPNALPSKAADRLSGRHEHVFLLARSPRYHFDLDAIRVPHAEHTLRYYGADSDAKQRPGNAAMNEQNPTTKHRLTSVNAHGANPGDVWSIATRPNREAHFATFPIDLPIRCIKAGCRPGGTVLDPFSGSGTTGEAARNLGRKYLGIDLNPAYHDLAVRRFAQGVLDFEAEEASA